MNKKTVKVVAIAIAVAVAAFLAWRWWSNRKSAGNGNAVAPGGSTDLNSVAPELIGGSSGPSVGPAVSLPVNITLQENSAPPPQVEDEDMESSKKGHSGKTAIHRQNFASGGPLGPQTGGGMHEEDAMQDAGISYPDEHGNANGGF